MRDLLAEDGSIYVHCDWRVNSYIRLVMDEVFGKERIVNDLIWHYKTFQGQTHRYFAKKHDNLIWYSKSDSYCYNEQFGTEFEDTIDSKRWATYINENRQIVGSKMPIQDSRFIRYLNKWKKKHGREPNNNDIIFEIKGQPVDSVWDMKGLDPKSSEKVGYPTQKPEGFIERIINSSTNENDIVCDFFCGSGTTAAVAEKLNRKWIVSDLGKFAIHTTRKRLIGVQRQLKADEKDYRAFEILNLGKYERQHYIGINTNLREEEKQKQLEQKERDFIKLILHAFRAEQVENFKCFHGKKAGRMVAVGPINLPVTRLFVEEIILECRKIRISRVDILAFEFEMGLFPNIQEEANNKGIDLAMKYIPREVFDKKAVEKNQVVFHDVSFIEVKPHVNKGKKNTPPSIAIELTDFSVFYSQDSIDNVAENLKNGKNKVVVEQGQIVKVNKDNSGIVTREVLTKNWTDWIDYWSVDFDFESKREIVSVKNKGTDKTEEVWTGDFIFENEWQSFRTKKDRSLDLKTPFHECVPGQYKVAVKVVDIFGNDTMKIIEVRV